MDPNTTTETYSASESQEISSSQQDSTDGQYGFDDANSTSSMQDEAVNSAIMEVSGELMLGNFATHKNPSCGSESSDISDDEARRAASGGSIAKYPESSTGMSDNDWNPYATESDTNQTPRSPRSNTSDDNRVGFVSRATINVGLPQERKKEPLVPGDISVGPSTSAHRVVQQNGLWEIAKDEESSQTDRTDSSSQRLEMLRFLVDKEAQESSPRTEEERLSEGDVVRSLELADGNNGLGMRDRYEQVGDEDERESRESQDTVRSVHSEGTLSGRQSVESRKSDEAMRESFESDKGAFERNSGDFEQDHENRCQSGESAKSRQSVESWKSGGSVRSELEKSGDSNLSGRQSAGSHLSQRSEHSESSQRSTGRTSDRSERLDRLNEAADSGIKEVIEFENAQRATADRTEPGSGIRSIRESSGSPVSRMRLTAKLQPYSGPQTVKSPQDVQNIVGRTGYVSIAERERLLTESPDPIVQTGRFPDIPKLEFERSRPTHSNTNLPKFSEVERSPSEVSMKRVSNLFEETKQAARAAVALTRPEPSGSEERFPLRDRMDHSIHEHSLMSQEQRRSFEEGERGAAPRPRESEVARSLNSEEVARVLGRYSEDNGDTGRSKHIADEKSPVNESPYIRISSVGGADNSYTSASSRETANSANSQRMDDMSDDEIARRVRAILSETDRLGQTGGSSKTFPKGGHRQTDYVPGTIDYTRLHRDLEEIQDSLHDIPKPRANDSLHLIARERSEPVQKRSLPADEEYKSLESTNTTVKGRESGTSEVGSRLVWDHGADLEYDDDYDGKFLGTMTSSATGTMSSRLKYGTENSDDMVVRPISSASNDTERDVPDLESTGSRTLNGADMARAEKLVQQVMNRQAEGDLKENVEDIIARYRNERQDMYDRLHTEPEQQSVPRMTSPPEIPGSLKKPELYIKSSTGEKRDPPGMAERVFNILTNGKEDIGNDDPDPGMAKEVYKILTMEPPHQQVNGILTQTTAEENEMLKKMVSRPKDDSTSMDDSGLNGSGDSFQLEDKDIRKQLEWSQFSSPNKTGYSDMAAIRKVTSAPYSSVSNVKSLLSSQLEKVTQRNFDHSVELRTPYRQNIVCYPVSGVELDRNRGLDRAGQREAWKAGSLPTDEGTGTRAGPLSSERFFLTDRDVGQYQTDEQRNRHRTHSDPFDVSPSRRTASIYRDGHIRSKSEEPVSPSDLSQYSFVDLPSSPVEPPKSDKPVGLTSGGLVTPKQHRPQDSRREGSPSPTESDTSGSKKGSRLRPYRPAGSRDMYYTESGDDTNESGTTIESTHPGSDDAIPPYIPKQFLGSRQDEPNKHPTGIYGRKDKDDLSTIDENSAKLLLREIFAPKEQLVLQDVDEKEKALSVSGGSNRSSKSNPARPADDLKAGRRSPSIRSNPDSGLGVTSLPYNMRDSHETDTGNLATRPLSPYSQRENPSTGSSQQYTRDQRDRNTVPLERPGFKTREEFQREFEARERALQEELARYRQLESRDRDPLATSVRSDPGEALTNPGMRWEFRESNEGNEFRELQPEPVYPKERLRNSRSRSETDLVAMSPAESQKYSSPMQPGTRFMELSTQPSPIFSDSVHYQTVGRGEVPANPRRVPSDHTRAPADLPRVPVERERLTEPRELPRVDDRSRGPSKSSSADEPVRPLEPTSAPVLPLEPVELGADPRRMGGMRRTVDERPVKERPKSPLNTRQKEMEKELEQLNRDLTEQVNEIQGNRDTEQEQEFEDNFPPSKKAQVLREVLEQEYQDNIPPNINDMWLRFKEKKEQSMTESSLNSTRLDALSGLLDNPAKHTVTSTGKDKDKSRESRSKEGQVNSGKGTGEPRRERRMSEEEAVEERSQRRKELKQRSGLSEEESNGSYTELLMDQEKKKAVERVRKIVRKKEKNERASKENKAPDVKRGAGKSRKTVVKDKPTDKAVITDIKSRNYVNTQHSDTMDTLFSIPEDASFEQSPSKIESDLRSRQRRHRHVIDPLMKKLRDKIKLQRDKIDKERRKELQRMEKLKKLHMLLNAKQGGKLSDKAIHVELENVSTTSSCTQSETSHIMSDTTLTAPSTVGDSEFSSQESTMMDSTVGTIKIQPKKYPSEEFSRRKKPVIESDSTDTSDFSNIVIERVQQSKGDKAERKTSAKKTSGKSKKSKYDEDGNRIKKSKKKKKEKDVFGVELTDEDLDRQLKRYERQMSPDGRRQHSSSPDRRRALSPGQKRIASQERGRISSPERRRISSPEQRRISSPERRRMVTHGTSPERRRVMSPDRRRVMQDACTMYPSPITVSPPSRRRMRDVIMRSEAIQTSPSIRSSSPTYSYDEVPVAPVPVMSRSKTARRRPSPTSPPRQPLHPRSAPVIQRKTSKSPVRSEQTTPRQFSKSPPRRKTSRSPAEKTRRSGPFIPRKTDESMWKVETEQPPANSMFTPESPISAMDIQDKPGQAWFVPMKASKPWKQPQKMRQAFAVRQEAWQPSSVSQSTWKNILHGDILKDKEDPNDVSRDTKFDLDPDGQPIRDEDDVNESEESDDEDKSKPLSKMSLQEAFLSHQQNVISRVRERQKRLNLAAEERKMQVFLEQEREKLFQEERKKEANPEAHPYSDNLFRPTRRVISKEEMKESTEKKYKKLPEVLEKEKLKKRTEDYSLNRLKARLFNRRIQKRVLQKAEKWGR